MTIARSQSVSNQKNEKVSSSHDFLERGIAKKSASCVIFAQQVWYTKD
ncbi:hypothetical protein EXIGUO9Y_130021 [Exiguobacterium oxidotolerans]|uniref:Uncharacterized protein n=1 Tax=Exiguobacterium oxidotolerans TaxID=223958 RepID=A0A653I409_9BACL|nr:hypothetical protein EXIGUO9Y_130021 [Exiguobacterium oxidotolerans]